MLSLVELGGASFIGAAEDGSVSTPHTAGQAQEAPVNETPIDEGHAPATMHANSTPFTVDGAAARVGAAAAEGVGAAAAARVGAAAAARVGAAAAEGAGAAAAAGAGSAAAAGAGAAAAARVGAAAAGVDDAAAAAIVGTAAATDGAKRDACTPYERRSPVVAGLDSTPRGPTHPPPPPGPPPAQSHIAPEIEAEFFFTHFHKF